MVRALLLFQDPELPSSRIRVVRMAPHLERAGVRCELERYPKRFADKMRLMRRLGQFDVVLLQKKLPALLDVQWLSRAPKLVFDYDDAIMMRDRPRDGSHESRTRRTRFHRVVRMSDGLIAGNRYLASLANHARTLIAPSPVPHEVPQRAHAEADRIRVGWIGLGRNLLNLDLISEAFRRLGDRVTLTVISNERYETDRFRVENVPWSEETQEAELAKLDVGIMPLELDSPFTRGKCAYKLLQYMAAGVPCVASPVGMNAELIEPEENGLLAATPDDWVAAIEALHGSVELRRRLGATGRATVEAEYTYPVVAERLAGFLREIGAPERPTVGQRDLDDR